MANPNSILQNACIEILIPIGTESESRVGDTNQSSSFIMQSRMPGNLDGSAKDEHSYAYSNRKRAFEGKEKDHCYTSKLTETVDSYKHPQFNSKTGVHKEHSYSTQYSQYRSMHSGSDEDLSLQKADDPLFLKDSLYLLPHYQSSDSALDVTGFDSISEKCLSSEHLNVKTVDVFTERCIIQGRSDPDISKMTLRSFAETNKAISLPNSPPTPDIEDGMLLQDHTYSFFSKGNGTNCDKLSWPYIWSPLALQDHSYDMSMKRKSATTYGGLKRGRSTDNIDCLPAVRQMSVSDFTKSPFLDHTYQSVELKNKNSKTKTQTECFQNISNNNHHNRIKSSANVDKVQQTFKIRNSDHTYEKRCDGSKSCTPKVASSSTRFRSNSEHLPMKHSSTDGDQVSMEDDEDQLSDSGTESLDGDNYYETPMVIDEHHGGQNNSDHSYGYKSPSL